jgi:hypothetical protein
MSPIENPKFAIIMKESQHEGEEWRGFNAQRVRQPNYGWKQLKRRGGGSCMEAHLGNLPTSFSARTGESSARHLVEDS